ncbi:glycosyltransferase [Alicyclobacillus sp. ALC3]|uniref:glycosyltransferase n=1 Tax=Alicyclobacillus sp. ALC3 TaxID=2796143 RepID=UPI002379993D|nr:glycosyltransferase family 2 protein [Alicyclobacillus sp. ALC3]WDL97671.1 glycosyltransferase [Alicyclobacillus sp. ALC3]
MFVTLLLVPLVGLICGLVLFRGKSLPIPDERPVPRGRISVIIPARNEEQNLPRLFESLATQTTRPDQAVLVDDHSSDGTSTIGERYGVEVYRAPELPTGWTGKNWALWNGYLHADGDILVFLDADVRLAPRAVESLLLGQSREGGVVSVVPYHLAEKFYEKFAMVFNVLGIFAFGSPFERRSTKKGVYGACIVVSRKDYETIGGHESIRSEMLDDLNLGARFQNAGIPVTNYIGRGLVSFRMYSGGMRSEVEGFSKGAILSTASLHGFTLLFVILWIIGLLVSQLSLLFIHIAHYPLLLVGYVLYAIQFLYFNRSAGRFGLLHPVCHLLSTMFFLVVVGYSTYQAVFRKRVVWKGRYIHVGGGRL